jgi:hypothetical protein
MALGTCGLVGLLGLGLANALQVREVRAITFPFITLVFGLAFSYGMTRQLLGAVRLWYVVSGHGRLAALSSAVMSVAAGIIRLWNRSGPHASGGEAIRPDIVRLPADRLGEQVAPAKDHR